MKNYDADKIYQESTTKDILYVKGGGYSNLNSIMAIPTRGMIHCRIVLAWKALMMPLNSNIETAIVEGMEVGEARNAIVDRLLNSPDKNYIIFLDDDVIPPEDALISLFRVMNEQKYDIMAGLYHMKSQLKTPLAFRYINQVLTNIPLDEELSNKVYDVDIVGMGMTILKKEVFLKMQKPYFKTIQELNGNRTRTETEDVYFCKKAKQLGFKIGIHTGVNCKHLDVNTGISY